MNTGRHKAYLFIFILSVSFLGCSLKANSEDVDVALAELIFFPKEAEKILAHRLKDIYEVKGELKNDPTLHETAWGAAYIPHLIIDVEEILKVENSSKNITSSKTGREEYINLTCRQVSEGIHGIYEMDESIQAAIDHKVRVRGLIYRCENNWYICDEDETRVYCTTSGKAYRSDHIELLIQVSTPLF